MHAVRSALASLAGPARGERSLGAEASARRWVALQPDLPAAWRNLSATLAAVGKSAEAAEAGYHDVALSRNALAAVDFARTMLSARRYDIVDSLLRAWRHTSDPVLLDGTRDIGIMLDRERGRIAESVAALADLPPGNGLSLVRADGLARLGRMSEARAIFERVGHPPGSSPPALTAPEARGFSWSHALEADALVRAGDTTLARSLVDSIARSGAQSYYGRDKVLHHHVRGVLLLAQGRSPTPNANWSPPNGPRTRGRARTWNWRALVSRSAAPTARSRRSATRTWPRWMRWRVTYRARRSTCGCRARSPPRTNPTARPSTPRMSAKRGATRIHLSARALILCPLMGGPPGLRASLGSRGNLGGRRKPRARRPRGSPRVSPNAVSVRRPTAAARTAGSRRAGSSSAPPACRSC